MDDMDIAGQVRGDEVQPTEEDGSRSVMGDVATTPAKDSRSVVNLKDNVAAGKDCRFGQEREDHGEDLEGGGFATKGATGRVRRV